LKLVIASGTFGKYAKDAFQDLLSHFEEVQRIILSKDMTDEEVVEKLSGANVVVVGAVRRLTQEVIESLPSLKLIAVHGVGLDGIDLETATKRGIPVIYTRGTDEEYAVAELTITLILDVARQVTRASQLVKQGRWNERSKLIGTELRGKTLGIIGFGNIGRQVAKIIKGFGVKVIAYDPYVPDNVFKEFGVKRAITLDYLLERSDIITIHCPLTEETRGLLNAERLDKVKDGAILVNTARGAIIDEVALAEKIKQGKIRAAALDVLTQEPPDPDNLLLKLDEVIITPHIGAYTTEALERMDRALIEDIIRFLKGERPIRVANPEVFS